MKEEFTKVKFIINIPYDKPNKNGIILTKEAVENAINNFPTNAPIIYKDSENNFEDKVIGITTDDPYIAEWDSENQICSVTINGNTFGFGAEITINEIKDNIVSSFEIKGIGAATKNRVLRGKYV